MTVDPIEGMQARVDSYDVEREACVYGDRAGERWWTKAFFSGREKGERSIEISRRLAIAFINNEYALDDWLTRFYPKEMNVYKEAMTAARQQLLIG